MAETVRTLASISTDTNVDFIPHLTVMKIKDAWKRKKEVIFLFFVLSEKNIKPFFHCSESILKLNIYIVQ